VRNRSAQGIKLTDREITRFEILTTQEPDNKRKQEDLDASTAHISKKKPNREARSKKEIPPLETISEGLLKAALKKQKKEN